MSNVSIHVELTNGQVIGFHPRGESDRLLNEEADIRSAIAKLDQGYRLVRGMLEQSYPAHAPALLVKTNPLQKRC